MAPAGSTVASCVSRQCDRSVGWAITDQAGCEYRNPWFTSPRNHTLGLKHGKWGRTITCCRAAQASACLWILERRRTLGIWTQNKTIPWHITLLRYIYDLWVLDWPIIYLTLIFQVLITMPYTDQELFTLKRLRRCSCRYKDILPVGIKMIKQGPGDIIWFLMKKYFFSLEGDIFRAGYVWHCRGSQGHLQREI